MTAPLAPGVALHPVEVDLLCAFAEVQPPFPIEVPAAATSDLERGVLYRAAAEELAERGLADESGPLDVAEEFVYLLRACTGVLDIVLNGPSGTLGIAVLAVRDEALVLTQDQADPNGLIRMWAATVDEALGRVTRMIPRAETPLTAPFSLPMRPLEEAFAAMLTRLPAPDGPGTPNPMTQPEIDELLHAHGIDDRVTRRMIAHLQPVLGNGQAGTATRDDTEDQWHRTGQELRWLDTPRGRYRLATTPAEETPWLSVNPLSTDELVAHLRSLAHTTRG
ncbi:ESX secretion-associated protein EspG [Actinokineospora cianjurensis]|uniref:ESAT-6 protein secretion system EspG family protein n=1 Tax=Actinokineospora cianjurensis TaxID=585224 RepID=A0A421AXU0_9PSEU|nr:ESX secretion-associated protein EspG [Actinokineospora cianjurensis]RLK54665.1 ESAT-6 protein secretion system EspG family protein [Actinokineospora cianjurensis]